MGLVCAARMTGSKCMLADDVAGEYAAFAVSLSTENHANMTAFEFSLFGEKSRLSSAKSIPSHANDVGNPTQETVFESEVILKS